MTRIDLLDLLDPHELRGSAEAVLAALAGPDARLREDQWTAIEALVAHRRRALVVQRTGWGKSAVYFVATALLRAAGAGPTVIVSPLLALMRNQVAAAARAGVHAATINSSNMDSWEQVREQVSAGQVDVLLVSPERLNNPDFRDSVLPALTATAGMLVVDEAHCISDWGHDFRPDYRRLRTLITELPDGVPVLATTATANDRVVRDVAEQLAIAADPGGDALVLRGSLDRDSLHLSVLSLPAAEQRLAWLAAHLDQLPGSGIVYVLTVAAADDVATFLRSAGHAAVAYTGRTDAAERESVEADLLANRVKAVVATSALGMGFDKPDLGFVVHLGAPASPIAYYQQVGRAGRGVRRAEVLLLPGPEDREIWAYFASLAFPPELVVRRLLEVLTAADGAADGVLSTPALESRVELNRTRLEVVLKVLDVDGAVRRIRGGWVATGQPWHYDAERYTRIAQARRAEQQAMLSYVRTTGCRMEFLRRELDDPAAAPCGRCDNCTGRHWPTEIPEAARSSARTQLRRLGVQIAPRRQWPTGMAALGVDLTGRISPDEQPEPGRALGRLTDVGWGTRLRALFSPEAADGPVPDELFDACVTVLADWDWSARPVGVVALASRSRPVLVADLAERIATVGRLPLLGTVSASGGAVSTANSAHRAAALLRSLCAPELPTLDGPVLLVDDRVDTGWTLTVAARALRRAGAPAVLPLTLATTT